MLLLMLLTATTAWADSSGSCGTNVTYTYSESTHTLTITGNGAMTDYANSNSQPWKDYRSNITSVVIESGVTHIGNNAFTDCSNLATVTFAAGSQLTSIGDFAFYYCNNSLNTITIPASVTSIGSSAFSNCKSLATVTFATGSQLTTIENSAFDNCSALTAFTVPSGVTSIGDGAFSNCSSLATINVEAGNIYYSSEDGVLFNKAKTILIQYPIGNSRTAYTIPGGVRTIGSHAFYFNKNLTSVTIATSVQTICDNAFYGCPYLATVAFAPCSQLESIGVNAFRYCTSLTSVTIPASVASIRERAFDSCLLLTSVTIYAPWLTTYGLNAFDYNKDGRKIFVPSGSLSTYKTGWNSYATAIEPLDYIIDEDKDVSILSDGTGKNVALKRAFPKGKKQTVCLPFAPEELLKYGKVWEFTGISDGKAVMTQRESGLQANTPYIFEATNDLLNITFPSVGISIGSDPKTEDATAGFTFHGTYTQKHWLATSDEVTQGTIYGFMAEDNDGQTTGQFVRARRETFLRPFSCYLEYNGALNDTDPTSQAPSLRAGEALPDVIDIVWQPAVGSTTSLSEELRVKSEEFAPAAGWYTLSGTRLSAQPMQKGVYIHNGRKEVVK